ncbi:MAG TPA: hypothetical protein VFB12_32075, partial [Ktedonobacteraceae bacterium]|nr:hypothetical protein [Ktedonobacteraceae bacterium]
GAQSRFFEGIRQVLLALCTNKAPGILFFDDIHQADGGTRALLSYLMLRLYEDPVCLIITWRTHACAMQGLKFLLSKAQRARNVTQLSLPRLSQSSIQQLAHEMLPVNPPQELIERLYTETEGLPRLLTEYLIALSKGELISEDDEWPLPGDIADWLSSRLAALGDDSRRILSAAAIIGRTFDFDTLCEASGRSEEEIVIALEELIGQGLIQEMQDTTETTDYLRRINEHMLIYAFRHEKLHHLVYEETSTARKRLLHRRITQTLTRQKRGYRDAAALTDKIVHHPSAAHSLLVLPGTK